MLRAMALRAGMAGRISIAPRTQSEADRLAYSNTEIKAGVQGDGMRGHTCKLGKLFTAKSSRLVGLLNRGGHGRRQLQPLSSAADVTLVVAALRIAPFVWPSLGQLFARAGGTGP